jgi:integrase
MKIKGLTQKRGWFYYRPPQVDGLRPARIALRTKDPNEAAILALELKSKSDLAISSGRLAGEVQRYLAFKIESKAFTRATAQATSSTLRQFEIWIGNPRVSAITSSRIEAWRVHLHSQGKPDNSVVTYLRRVQGLFSWLLREGKIARSPFADVKAGKIRRSKRVLYCTREQRDQLIDTCPNEDLKWVLMAGFFLGLRRREIVEAVPEWFHSGLCQVTETPWYTPKDKESRIIHYGNRFEQFLAGYGSRSPWMLRPNKEHGRAIYRVETKKWIEQHGAEQGMPWLRHHVMRHTFATLHVQAGTPIPTVADWLGDSVEVTYNHYVAYAPNPSHINNID